MPPFLCSPTHTRSTPAPYAHSHPTPQTPSLGPRQAKWLALDKSSGEPRIVRKVR